MNAKLSAWCGIVAPLVFMVALVVLSLLTPNYSQLTSAISELGASGAPFALAWNIAGFILVGFLIVAFAWGLHIALRGQAGAILLPLLVGLSGLGWAGLGFFPAAAGFRPSTQTTLHFVMVSLNFLSFILVAFLFAFRLRSDSYWKRWIAFSLVIGILAVASFAIPRTVPAGVSQRIGLAAYFVWLFVVSYASLRKAVNPQP